MLWVWKTYLNLHIGIVAQYNIWPMIFKGKVSKRELQRPPGNSFVWPFLGWLVYGDPPTIGDQVRPRRPRVESPEMKQFSSFDSSPNGGSVIFFPMGKFVVVALFQQENHYQTGPYEVTNYK